MTKFTEKVFLAFLEKVSARGSLPIILSMEFCGSLETLDGLSRSISKARRTVNVSVSMIQSMSSAIMSMVTSFQKKLY
jgi:hypothetical protein